MAKDIIINGDGRTMPSHFDPIVLKAFTELDEQFQALCDDYDNN
jgi:hypothetical protein